MSTSFRHYLNQATTFLLVFSSSCGFFPPAFDLATSPTDLIREFSQKSILINNGEARSCIYFLNKEAIEFRKANEIDNSCDADVFDDCLCKLYEATSATPEEPVGRGVCSATWTANDAGGDEIALAFQAEGSEVSQELISVHVADQLYGEESQFIDKDDSSRKIKILDPPDELSSFADVCPKSI